MTEIKNKNHNYPDHRFSVAPMLDGMDLLIIIEENQ